MEKFKKMETKKIVFFIVLLIPIVLVLVTISYAFFQSSGEVDEEKVTITSGTLSLTFRDNDDTVENIEGSWNFGDTIEKELVIENTGTRDMYAKISWDNLINTYLAESLTYTLEEKTDIEESTYKKVETESENVPRSETALTVLLADHLSIPAGHTYTYRLRITLEDLPDIDQTADINAKFVTKFTIAETTKKLTTEEKLANLNIKINPNNTVNFANPATIDETAEGLFSMEDDYGTSYYYRGTAPNNYIKFGTNASGQDMWWRIIRFNGDGSIRMQYDGAGPAGSNTYIRGFALTNQNWSLVNDAKYVGWMFGGSDGSTSSSKEEAQKNETSSIIKKNVDRWYKDNIVDTGYNKYVADEIFCNDRSTPGGDMTGWQWDTGLGYGGNPTAYGSFSRFGLNDIVYKGEPSPTLKCPEKNDAFTTDDLYNGNGALDYPVGLITADEIVIAGSGKYGMFNNAYYLYKAAVYYSMSPANFNNYPNIYALYPDGSLSYLVGTASDSALPFSVGMVTPVINLKSEYLNQLKGQGTLESPYHLP